MHMRTKKWAKPELAVCPYFTDEAETKRGHWREQFEREQPLYLELGCGKGVSTAAMVKDNPGINYVVMDITCNVLGDTRRNIEKAFEGEPVKNVMIARYDISYIEKVFAPEDRVERIYINFCWFKTDDTALFTESMPYFDACGFELRYLTSDLHAAGVTPNYISEHEMKFTALGVPIKFARFAKKPGKVELDPVRWVMPGAFARLREAAESDGE